METKVENRLVALYIYLTDRCNLKCFHCWQSAPLAGEGTVANLMFDECKPFLDEAISLGLRNVTLSGGEPLLNPEFHKFADYLYNNGVGVTMETNGLLISKEKNLKTIKDCKVHCAVSLDGINPETHNKQRGLSTAYESTVNSLKKLDEQELDYQLIMAISKFNYNELIPLMDWVKENLKHCKFFKINVINKLGRAEEMDKSGLLFAPEEIPVISDEIAKLVGNYPFGISLHVDPIFIPFKKLMLNYTCGGDCGYSKSLSILSNGKISICSLGKQMDRYIFGHVSNTTIKEVWEQNGVFDHIHSAPHLELKGICSNCIFRRECKGSCRAEALCRYGDFFAPSPRCQEYYNTGNFPKNKMIDPKKDCSYSRSE